LLTSNSFRADPLMAFIHPFIHPSIHSSIHYGCCGCHCLLLLRCRWLCRVQAGHPTSGQRCCRCCFVACWLGAGGGGGGVSGVQGGVVYGGGRSRCG
jgi:hypothetical protein